MNNLVSIIEIPVADFERSLQFYTTILSVNIEEVEMAGTRMGVIPADEGSINIVLVKGSEYIPTSHGVLIYLNCGNDLQPTLNKITQNGGTIIVPKTLISPDMGYFALFTDIEGNRIGLHSSN